MILTALLVIVVPEWLDGAGHRSRYPGHIDVPETPEFVPMKEIMEPLEIPDSKPAAEERPRPLARTTPEPEAPAPKPEPQAKPKPASGSSASSQSGIDAWALQVGSFSEEKNATVLRDQLRAKGYAAYMVEQGSGDSTQYRVRIGPELDRGRVDRLRDDVEKKEKIKGLVVKHP